MNVLIWHVHGAYTRAFVQGPHTYLIPATDTRDTWGLGRPELCDWPVNAVETKAQDLTAADIDIVVVQRPEEIALASAWLGRQLGSEIPFVYLEHNTPGGQVPFTRHPVADRGDCLLVHVTGFNALMWDAGRTRTVVVEHGVPDPGYRFRPMWPRLAAVVNDPLRRGRAVGTDLLPMFATELGVDLFGMRVAEAARRLGVDPAHLACHEDLPQQTLHLEMARRAAYLHLTRWTSLGLSLIEAMLMGMPLVVLATTAVPAVVPAGAGVISADPAQLLIGARTLVQSPAMAQEAGQIAREAAQARFGLHRFLRDWNSVLEECAAGPGGKAARIREVVNTP